MTAALTLEAVSKSFGSQVALCDVRLDVAQGEVHGLIGQNGSGKSTLIKLLAGVYAPDAGHAQVWGHSIPLGDPKAARQHGLRFVHQDLGLIPSMTSVENLGLGRGYATGRSRRILWSKERTRAAKAIERLGFSIDLHRPVSELSLAERSIVAIARAVEGCEDTGCLLVLDEPTAALSTQECDRLFDVMRGLRQQGHAILFVSHHLDEVLEECDRVSALRNGRNAGTFHCAEVSRDRLAEAVVGTSVDVSSTRTSTVGAAPDLSSSGLRVVGLSANGVHDLSFEIRPGEILGVAGLSGSGRDAIAPALIGAVPREGVVECAGRTVTAKSPGRAWSAGMAYLPGDRAAMGVLPELSVRENMMLARLRPHIGGVRLSASAEDREADEWLARLGVRPRRPGVTMSTLSGGNQQKVLAARALRTRPRVLIADDPTAGMDLGAKADLHAILEQAADHGLAILLASTDSAELARLANRVLVMHAGCVAGVIEVHGEADEARIDHAQLTAATFGTESAE